MLKHPHAAGFKAAIEVELKALVAKGTWREVSLDHAEKANKTPIPTRWVFKYKFDDKGYLIKYKARLCARGDLQKTDQDTFAATLAIRILRVLMAIVAAFDLETRQWDAVNAFANSDIDEPTYIKSPEGWKGDKVLLLLLRALYGLKQSPALWFRNLSQTLTDLGLEQVPEVECLFTNDYMMLFFFVDDIVVIYDKKHAKKVDEFQSKFFEAYEMRHLGEIEWFLGIRITRDRSIRQVRLCQDSYVDKLMTKFNVAMTNRAPGAPLRNVEPLVKNTTQASPQDIHAYQQIVGFINFAAITTRADIAFSASKLSEFLTNPSKHHQEAAMRVLQYLAHTKYYTIVYDGQIIDPQTVFMASSDASFADDVETRFSSQGYVFKLFEGLIDWKATKQKTVTTSSTEAELLGLTLTGKELLWWKRFFEAIAMDLDYKVQIECDNTQTIRIVKSTNSQFTTNLRHVDIHHHWLRQEYQKKSIDIKHTPTVKILADGLTKALSPQRHKEFVILLGLEDDKPIS